MAFEKKYMNTAWDSGRFEGKNIILKRPYNKDTLEYLNFCFSQGFMQNVYKVIRQEYEDIETRQALWDFFQQSWFEKMKREGVL